MKARSPRLNLNGSNDMQVSRFMIGLAVAVCFSGLGVCFQHRHEPERCVLDGSLINPLYEVEIVYADKIVKTFSCLGNARIWLQRNRGTVSFIRVTDEMTREKLAAEKAYYVLSRVMTTLHTQNRIHVFASQEAAQSHARQFDGAMVDNPLRVLREKPATLVTVRRDCPNDDGFGSSPSFKPLCIKGESVQTRLPVFGCSPDLSLEKHFQGHERRLERPPEVQVLTYCHC